MKNIIYSAMITLVITFAITAYSDTLAADLETGLVRLHVIANSDSVADQKVKLAVRDEIISDIGNNLSPDEYSKKAQEIANKVLIENGFNYGAAAQFTTAWFPKKEYREFTLPEGNYRAVRVVLGDGKGQNWWCVLYPPVCMADIRGEKMSEPARTQLRESLQEETYNVITGEVKIRLGIAEVIKRICKSGT